MAKRKPMGNRLAKGLKNQPKSILLLCAKTEEKYLRVLIKKYNVKNIKIRSGISVTIPNKKSLEKIERKIAEPFNTYQQVYHIFDLECPNIKSTQSGQVQGMIQHITHCKDSQYVTTIVQMTCIETWFLWVMGVTQLETCTAQDCEKKLKQKMPTYNKNNTPDWSELVDNTPDAINRYKNNEFELLDQGYFKGLNITNPMMQIADMLNDILPLPK